MIGVNAVFLPDVWDKAAPLIQKTLDRFPEYGWNLEEVRIAIEEQRLWLWVDSKDIDIVVLTKIVEQPTIRQCWIWLAGGKLPENYEEHLKDIEEWAKRMGCDYILEQGREGWQRKLGWERAYVVMQKRLKNG